MPISRKPPHYATEPSYAQCPLSQIAHSVHLNIIILGALCTAASKLSKLGILHHIFKSHYTFHTNFIRLPIIVFSGRGNEMQRSCVITEVASHIVNWLSTFLLDTITGYETEEEEPIVTH